MRLPYEVYIKAGTAISTHAPRAGCDSFHQLANTFPLHFNSRTPCGVRLPRLSFFFSPLHFNSRTPCGVRPRELCHSAGIPEFQLTHPVRGATAVNYRDTRRRAISTHAPRAGCDELESVSGVLGAISTHAPRAGCDVMPLGLLVDTNDFNSRTPCGVRHISIMP